MYIIYTWRTIRIRNFYPTPCSYHLSAKRPEIKKSWAFVALPFVSTTFWKSSRFRQGLILKCSHFGFFFPWCLMIFIWWCAPILWVHIQCIPMYCLCAQSRYFVCFSQFSFWRPAPPVHPCIDLHGKMWHCDTSACKKLDPWNSSTFHQPRLA